METKNNIKPVVAKAILGCNGKFPIALVKVPANVRTVRVAGSYTVNGDAVNVSVNKVTANKRFTKAERNNIFGCPYILPDAAYHAESDTYQIFKAEF